MSATVKLSARISEKETSIDPLDVKMRLETLSTASPHMLRPHSKPDVSLITVPISLRRDPLLVMITSLNDSTTGVANTTFPPSITNRLPTKFITLRFNRSVAEAETVSVTLVQAVSSSRICLLPPDKLMPPPPVILPAIKLPPWPIKILPAISAIALLVWLSCPVMVSALVAGTKIDP